MKRQGRQRGMVRTYPILPASWNPRPTSSSRNLNELSSPPTAGLFTKVPSRPTNHSKFTGKCGRVKCRDCHIHPASKSKEKTKGAQKSRSVSDTMSTHKLITWKVVGAAPGFKFSGFSASRVLDYLGSNDSYKMDHDCEPDYDDNEFGVDNSGADAYDENDDDEFCEVGFVWEPVADGDESWCFVEEM